MKDDCQQFRWVAAARGLTAAACAFLAIAAPLFGSEPARAETLRKMSPYAGLPSKRAHSDGLRGKVHGLLGRTAHAIEGDGGHFHGQARLQYG